MFSKILPAKNFKRYTRLSTVITLFFKFHFVSVQFLADLHWYLLLPILVCTEVFLENYLKQIGK